MQISIRFSDCEQIFFYTGSIMQTNCCSHQTFLAVVSAQIFLNAQNVMVSEGAASQYLSLFL